MRNNGTESCCCCFLLLPAASCCLLLSCMVLGRSCKTKKRKWSMGVGVDSRKKQRKQHILQARGTGVDGLGMGGYVILLVLSGVAVVIPLLVCGGG